MKSRPLPSDYWTQFATCCTRLEWGYGYEIVSKTSLRGAWLRDLWAALAGRPHAPVSSEDVITLKQLEIAPDEQLIAYFEQHPAPLIADGIDLALPAVTLLATSGVRLLVPLVTRVDWWVC